MIIYTLKKIETPRLIIRPVQMGDEEELSQAINRSLISLQRWMPWARNANLETTREFIERSVHSWQSKNSHNFPMAIVHKTDQKIIGASGFNEHSILIKPLYEIGYWIDLKYQGQGLATECVNGLTRYALNYLKAVRVQICTQVENIKSIAVIKRLGFEQEAIRKYDRIDCHSNQPANGFIFSCCNTNILPPLDVTWIHTKKRTPSKRGGPHKSHPPKYCLPVLQTKRLQLIPPRKQDIQQVYNSLVHSASEVSPWFPWAKPPLTIENLHHHIQEGIKAATNIKAHNHLFFLVWDKSQKHFLGEVRYKINDWSLPYLSISYWFDTRQNGHGYATEAITELVKYAFTTLRAKRIELVVSLSNQKNIRLAKRLGFVFEGVLKNCCRNFVTNEISDLNLFALTDISQLKQPQNILNWAKENLSTQSFVEEPIIKFISETPWSCVAQLTLKNKQFYLKQRPPALMIEPEIIKLLRNKCGIVKLPRVIAVNHQNHCFLMTACGNKTLRDFFEKKLQVKPLLQGIDIYKNLQTSTTNYISHFLNLGVSDFRLHKLPNLYQNLAHNEIILSQIQLPVEKITKLQNLLPRFKEICEELIKFNIADCLNHSDFHDNNLVVDQTTGEISIIDLGEVTISNPLFSLSAFLKTIADRYQLSPQDEDYNTLKLALFSQWKDNPDQARLLVLIQQLLPIYFILTQLKLIEACTCPSLNLNDKIYNACCWFINTLESKSE